MMKPESSATGMKRAGATSPSAGSRQRISASAPTTRAAAQLDLRLVVQAEAPAGQRLAHRMVELDVGTAVATASALLHAVVAAPAVLHRLHRGFGMAHQFVGAVAVARAQRARRCCRSA